jgi:hypothetical protein
MKNASRFVAFGAALALLPAASVFAQSPGPEPTDAPEAAPQQAPQQQGTTFESLDSDSDGRISKAEAEANANVKAQFTRYDVNGDGFIERAEVGQANQKGGETTAPAPQQ